MPYAPTVGDSVVIEDVQSGSRDVIGLTGTAIAPLGGEVFSVLTPFSATQDVVVLATKVRPA